MSSRRLLLENIASLSVLQGLNYAAPLVTLPYLVHVLRPPRFGLLSFVQGIVLYFDLFTDFGFNFSATRAIASCRYDKCAVSEILCSTIYAKALLMCISAAALTLLVRFNPTLRATGALFAVNFLYIIGTTFFPIWLFQGLERMKVAAVLFGIARLLTVPALLLFVRGPDDYVLAGAIQASVEVTASVLAWPYLFLRMRPRWKAPSCRGIATALKAAWPLFLSSSAFQASATSTTVILGFTAGKLEVGYFSAADKLIKAAIAALNPLSQALFPHIAAEKLRSRASALQLIRKTFLVVGFLSLSISLATALCARPVCLLVLGKSFEPSVAVLQTLSPLPLLFGLTGVFGIQTMVVFEMDALLSRIMFVSAIVGVPVTVALSASHGAVGAAVASVIIAATIVTIMWCFLRARGIDFWLRDRHSEDVPDYLATKQ